MARYATHLDEDHKCPNDPDFEHRLLFGLTCVPRDFSERTGRSRTYRQTRVIHPSLNPPHGYRYLWDGGCDALLRASLPTLGQGASSS